MCSSDLSRLALVGQDEREGLIQILALSAAGPREIPVKLTGLNSVHWSADGKGLFVSAQSAKGAALLYADLEGHTEMLWQQAGNNATSGVPSPDGRYLAILGITVESNAWLLEGF